MQCCVTLFAESLMRDRRSEIKLSRVSGVTQILHVTLPDTTSKILKTMKIAFKMRRQEHFYSCTLLLEKFQEKYTQTISTSSPKTDRKRMEGGEVRRGISRKKELKKKERTVLITSLLIFRQSLLLRCLSEGSDMLVRDCQNYCSMQRRKTYISCL